jgi:hypothetical protein
MPPVYPAGSYPAQVVADGAVAYWRLGETSGTTAVDVISGNNGTISGGVTLNQPGALADGDKAMLFDGSGVISIPPGTFLAIGTGPVTLECWFKTALVQSFVYPLDFKNNGSATNPGVGFLTGGAGQVYFSWCDGTALSNLGLIFSYADGQWHHLVGVVTRGAPDMARLYLDGVERATQPFSTSGVSLTSTTTAGIGGSGTIGRIQGLIDDVALYPTALTPTQIAAHYAARTFGALCAPFLWLEDVDMPKYNLWTPITPSDTADLLRVTDGIWVGGAGNVAAVMQNNTVPTTLVVPAGAWLPIVARRINATGTTATGLVALNCI